MVLAPYQWRIQDFPRGGGANPQGGDANLLFSQKIPENCMKMKEFGSRGGGGTRPWRPPYSRTKYANDKDRLIELQMLLFWTSDDVRYLVVCVFFYISNCALLYIERDHFQLHCRFVMCLWVTKSAQSVQSVLTTRFTESQGLIEIFLSLFVQTSFLRNCLYLVVFFVQIRIFNCFKYSSSSF